MASEVEGAMESWAAVELRHARLGDARLNLRLVRVVEDLAAKPTASVPEASGTWAATKGAYRFWDSDRVTPEAIRAGHVSSTLERVGRHELVLGVSDVPNPEDLPWVEVVSPKSIPSERFAVDLRAGELAVIALGLENPERIVLLDDLLARRIARAAGLRAWGTLTVLLEAKPHGLVDAVRPYVSRLSDSGMWMSTEIRRRILRVAGEI